MWRWSQRRELTMPFSWPVWTNGSRSTMQTQTSTGSAMQMTRTLSGTQKRNWWPRTSTAASLKPLLAMLLPVHVCSWTFVNWGRRCGGLRRAWAEVSGATSRPPGFRDILQRYEPSKPLPAQGFRSAVSAGQSGRPRTDIPRNAVLFAEQMPTLSTFRECRRHGRQQGHGHEQHGHLFGRDFRPGVWESGLHDRCSRVWM